MSDKLYHLFIGLALLLMAACSTDDTDNVEPVAPAPSGDMIVICGSHPSLSATTRSVNPPALTGVCQADRLQIWVYTYKDNGLSWANATNLTWNTTLPAITLSNTQQEGSSINRWAKQDFTYTFARRGATSLGQDKNNFAIPALAYINTDVAKFEVNTGANYTQMSLQLSSAALAASPMTIPELYFGRLRFLTTISDLSNDWTDGTVQTNWNESGFFRYLNKNTSDKTFTNPLSGHLYRMVSQINVNMTEVPTTLVDHLELYMTNVPKKVTLYGTHGNVYGTDGIGRFYPLTAVTTTSDCIDGNTCVATTNDFTDDEAHLSAFFLPSEVGGELMLRVYYKAGAVKDALGNDVLQRDYNIQPGKSALMTGNDADVYNVQTPALQSGSDLYVYNSTNHKFYSYANVRVNINGKYENVAAEEQDVTITLEVEPGYEREHRITIN